MTMYWTTKMIIMKISIIITTKNEEFNLTRLLNSMLKIKNKVEVIVVDAGSTDKTCEIAKNHDFVRLISAPNTLRGEMLALKKQKEISLFF